MENQDSIENKKILEELINDYKTGKFSTKKAVRIFGIPKSCPIDNNKED